MPTGFDSLFQKAKEHLIEHATVNGVVVDIEDLNTVLKPYVAGTLVSTQDEIDKIRASAAHLSESVEGVLGLSDLSNALQDLLIQFISSDENMQNIEMIKDVVKLKDALLQLLKKLQWAYFEKQLELFIEKESDENKKKLKNLCNNALDELEDLRDGLSEIRDNFADEQYQVAIAELNKIRHAARGLDNSFNEIGATILGTTAIPLHGALHEYLGSIDATITARDGDKIESYMNWVSQHMGKLQDMKQSVLPAPFVPPKPKPD